MKQPLSVSVVICAYSEERWSDILAAVESVRRQELTPAQTILVVDHNPNLFLRARAHLPDILVIQNRGERGLSGARNSGVDRATGDLTAFLDDDAVAAPTWLARIVPLFADPRVMGADGAVEPDWKGGQPAWFPDEFLWVVGCSYRGLPQVRARIRNLLGCCMCLRREVFEVVGGFRYDVGRDRGRPMGCEETELCIRANQQWPDRIFLHEPESLALHSVPGRRGSWSYFRARCYAEGLSKARVSRHIGSADGLASEWTYTIITLPLAVLRYLSETVSKADPVAPARAAAVIAGLAVTTAGYLVGRLQQMTLRAGRRSPAMSVARESSL